MWNCVRFFRVLILMLGGAIHKYYINLFLNCNIYFSGVYKWMFYNTDAQRWGLSVLRFGICVCFACAILMEIKSDCLYAVRWMEEKNTLLIKKEKRKNSISLNKVVNNRFYWLEYFFSFWIIYLAEILNEYFVKENIFRLVYIFLFTRSNDSYI